jgi:hypothetical protein
VALLEKRRYLNNRSGDFPQVILIVPSHVPNTHNILLLDTQSERKRCNLTETDTKSAMQTNIGPY